MLDQNKIQFGRFTYLYFICNIALTTEITIVAKWKERINNEGFIAIANSIKINVIIITSSEPEKTECFKVSKPDVVLLLLPEPTAHWVDWYNEKYANYPGLLFRRCVESNVLENLVACYSCNYFGKIAETFGILPIARKVQRPAIALLYQASINVTYGLCGLSVLSVVFGAFRRFVHSSISQQN